MSIYSFQGELGAPGIPGATGEKVFISIHDDFYAPDLVEIRSSMYT